MFINDRGFEQYKSFRLRKKILHVRYYFRNKIFEASSIFSRKKKNLSTIFQKLNSDAAIRDYFGPTLVTAFI